MAAEDHRVARRHIPDTGVYYPPELAAQLPVPSAHNATILPMSKPLADGRSSGFDGRYPGRVVVDPGMADGGFIFDPSQLDSKSFNHVAREGSDPVAIMRQFSQADGDTIARPLVRRVNPKVGADTYIVPDASLPPVMLSATQAPQAPPATATQHRLQPVNASRVATIETATPAPSVTPAVDPMLLQLLTTVLQTQQQTMEMLKSTKAPDPVEHVVQAAWPVTDPLPAPIAASRRRPPADVRVAESINATPAPSVPLEESSEDKHPYSFLSIPSLTDVKPERPKHKVIFTYPGIGKMMASYHEVIVTPEMIVLVYDTRYEDGEPYVPQTQDGTVELRIVRGPETFEDFKVGILGLNYSLGVYDHTVLVLMAGKAVDSTA